MERLIQLSSLLLLIVTIIKCLYSNRKTAQELYLCLTLFALFHLSMVLSLAYSGAIFDFAHIFRTGTFATYLLVPGAYLYVKKAISRDGFHKHDLLYFIPALFYLIDLGPFLLQSATVKEAALRADIADKALNVYRQSWMKTGRFHFFMQNAYGIVMALNMAWMVFRFVRKGGRAFYAENKTLVKWLYLWSFLLFMACLPDAIGFWAGKKPDIFNQWFLSPCLFVNLLYPISLLVSPSILYGVKGIWLDNTPASEIAQLTHNIQAETDADTGVQEMDKQETLTVLSRKIYYAQDQADTIKSELDALMQSQRPFINPDYSINALARDSGYTVRQVSSLLNNFCMLSFRDYINSFRIQCFIDKYNNVPEAKKMTMEALAKDCGFTSRYTFIHAFKKFSGKTPSEYFDVPEAFEEKAAV